MELDVLERLEDRQRLDEVLRAERVVLFKHSTRCPISSHALSEMEEFHQCHPELPLFVIHVVENRELSDTVSRLTGVRHESPQLLLLETGAVSWHASHFDITRSSLEERLRTS